MVDCSWVLKLPKISTKMRKKSKISSARHRNISRVLHHVKEYENISCRENTRWLVVSKWLETFEKVFVFFGGKFKSSGGPLEEARLFKSDKRPCQWFGWFFNIYMAGSDSCLTQLSPSICFGVVNNISYHFLTVFHLSLSANLLGSFKTHEQSPAPREEVGWAATPPASSLAMKPRPSGAPRPRWRNIVRPRRRAGHWPRPDSSGTWRPRWPPRRNHRRWGEPRISSRECCHPVPYGAVPYGGG